jgi:molybdopterin synthase catalytic subunit
MAALTHEPLDLSAAIAAVSAPTRGALLLFVGVTRGDFEGRRVLELSYEAWEEVALLQLGALESEIAQAWPGAAAFLVHRLGVVGPGEASVALAVAAPHRAEAYAASRFAIEALKARVEIWKKEVYEDGSTWKANAPADGLEPPPLP